MGLKLCVTHKKEFCSIELPTNEKNWKSRGFAFIPCPGHVRFELMKLYGIDSETCITVEEDTSAKSRVNKGAKNSVTRRQQVVVNQFLENQYVLFKPSVVPGN